MHMERHEVRVVRREVRVVQRGACGAARCVWCRAVRVVQRGECGAARCVWCSAHGACGAARVVRVVQRGAVRRGAQWTRCRPRNTSPKISMNHQAADQRVEQRGNIN